MIKIIIKWLRIFLVRGNLLLVKCNQALTKCLKKVRRYVSIPFMSTKDLTLPVCMYVSMFKTGVFLGCFSSNSKAACNFRTPLII